MSRNYETTLIGWAGLKVYKTFRKLHVRLMQPDDFYNEAHAAIDTLHIYVLRPERSIDPFFWGI